MPFLGIDVDHSDSGREGATVSTLAVTADLANWKEAAQLTMQEVGGEEIPYSPHPPSPSLTPPLPTSLPCFSPSGVLLGKP